LDSSIPHDRAREAWTLYERTVQDPVRTVDLLLRLHGRRPQVLGEDFAGTGALSRAWVGRVEDGRAFAVDLDAEALAFAPDPRVLAHALDVRDPTIRRLGPCDIVHAGNFSLGELHTRAELESWARTARERLAPGGIAVADTYGGESAWRLGALERRRAEPGGEELRWIWEQRSADPLTGEVVDALSFRVLRAGEVVVDLPDAFVYRWRLWSVPELVDALRAAGFARCEVHVDLPGPARAASACSDGRALHSGCVALVVGRA
jgi:hypothetical protein